MIITAIIGPIEANPSNPKPSDMADLRDNTELKPIPSERMIGTAIRPVVTPPASKATGIYCAGVKKDRIITKGIQLPASRPCGSRK